MKRSGVTRRQLAAAMMAAPAAAQTPPAKPANELEAARSEVRRASDTLRKFKVPQLLEPAITFRP
jgi:hypothetical protein